jgi:hypothetical protein
MNRPPFLRKLRRIELAVIVAGCIGPSALATNSLEQISYLKSNSYSSIQEIFPYNPKDS